MSAQYDHYLYEHKAAVATAFSWIDERMPDILLPEFYGTYEYNIKFAHDESKNDIEEYDAYDNYFYGNRSHKVVEDFNRAWLHHIHNNPHHWQYWVLFEDDPSTGKPYKALDMPDPYIIEMICDWWSFSFRSGNLHEIFDWYDEHKKTMVLSDTTRKRVEYVLDRIRKELEPEIVNEKPEIEEGAVKDESDTPVNPE